jgi:hypothetical protein
MTTHSGRSSTPCEVSDAALTSKESPSRVREPNQAGSALCEVGALIAFLMSEDAGFMTAGTYDITAAADRLISPRRERVTITNISVQLPPSPIEQDARQGIRRAHAEANRRIGYVIDLFRGRS